MQGGVRTGPEHTHVCETGSAGEFIGKAEEEGISPVVDNAADGLRNRLAPGS